MVYRSFASKKKKVKKNSVALLTYSLTDNKIPVASGTIGISLVACIDIIRRLSNTVIIISECFIILPFFQDLISISLNLVVQRGYSHWKAWNFSFKKTSLVSLLRVIITWFDVPICYEKNLTWVAMI